MIKNNNDLKKFVVFILLCFSLYFCVRYFSNEISRSKNVEYNLSKTVSSFRNKFPIKIDENTTLDTATNEGKVVHYYYTLWNVNKDSVDLLPLKENMQLAIESSAAENPELNLFKKEGITMFYHYSDSLGRFMFSSIISFK